MIRGFLYGLLVAWLLTFLHADTMLIQLVQPFVSGVTLTTSYYFLMFGLLGMVSRILRR